MTHTKMGFLRASVLPALGLALALPLHAQQPAWSAPPTGAALLSVSQDDTDIDFDHCPIPVSLAHGFSSGNVAWHSGPTPAPQDPQAGASYLQARELRNKGFVYLCYRRYDKALARLQQSLALWPDSAPTYRMLAETYEAEGRTQAAIADYRLLFYGWPGQTRPDPAAPPQRYPPADKPRGYNQTDPAEVDPTLLMQFSLLLQQTGQFAEARSVYERGMQCLAVKVGQGLNVGHLPPPLASALTTPAALEAATRTALAINQDTYQDVKGAKENLSQALLLQPGLAAAQYQQAKMLQEGR